jgi:hypothetical protein
MAEKKDVHFGERFYDTTLYIKKNFHLKSTQIATEMGIDNATLSRWIGWKTFKPQQHRKQEALRKFGINPLFFREADVEEMLLPGVDNSIEAEIVKAFTETGEAITEQSNDMKKLIDLVKEVIKGNDEIKKEMKNMNTNINKMLRMQRKLAK